MFVDIIFNREACLLLNEEIEAQGEALSMIVNIFGHTQSGGKIEDMEKELIGQCVVDLYVMIEDEVSIVRQVNYII